MMNPAMNYSARVLLLKHNFKIAGDCSVFRYFRRSEFAKHLMGFQIGISVFKFCVESTTPQFCLAKALIRGL